MGKTIVISNLKGGCGKSLTTVSLGVGLARQGKRVLCIDADEQASMTVSFGICDSENLNKTLTSVISNIITDVEFKPTDGIIQHKENIDFLPSDISLANMELSLVPIMGRENVLRQYINMVKANYDFVLLDTSPSLGLLTLNALVAADYAICPVAPKFLDAKGLELLLKTIAKVRKQVNPNLSIAGILLTMVDRRAGSTRDIISLIENTYGNDIHIFKHHIPHSVRAAETSAHGKSIFLHDPRGKVAAAYTSLVEEVLEIAQ